ncbi:hypothetical protein L1987_73112 [Smallanthus sonchifolius]|uniref:Uncharacterized protein n=1 Tax=Smallanthus sonchifolius TaxID=185202 RepID=A0ACB8ZZW6_9ASTR|nr:hypothetical protein L1987_73112 [Smallanthus sonchifolius]
MVFTELDLEIKVKVSLIWQFVVLVCGRDDLVKCVARLDLCWIMKISHINDLESSMSLLSSLSRAYDWTNALYVLALEVLYILALEGKCTQDGSKKCTAIANSK